jgi:hypothetical protein
VLRITALTLKSCDGSVVWRCTSASQQVQRLWTDIIERPVRLARLLRRLCWNIGWLSRRAGANLGANWHRPKELPFCACSCTVLLDVFTWRCAAMLVGTEIVRSVHRELTGMWLDEAQPDRCATPFLSDRYRFYRRNREADLAARADPLDRDPMHQVIENCPVAARQRRRDGRQDFAFTVLFDASGRDFGSNERGQAPA